MPESVDITNAISRVKSEMIRIGYAKRSIEAHEYEWKRFAGYAENRNASAFTRDIVDDYLRETYHFPQKYIDDGPMDVAIRNKIRAIRNLESFHFQGQLPDRLLLPGTPCPDRFSHVCEQFTRFCSIEGRSQRCVDNYSMVAKQFLNLLADIGVDEVVDIDMGVVDTYIASLEGYSKYTIKAKLRMTRIFLKYLSGAHGAQDFSESVPHVKVYAKSHIPTTLTSEQEEQLLASFERCNPLGRRDYAIFVLALDLGLRGCDITGLCFENIDWEHKCLRLVQQKTKNVLELPLSVRVYNAIAEYLKYGRPKAKTPYVFVKHIAPFDKLQDLWMVMDRALRSTGVKLEPESSRGLHILRHTLATNLLRGGVPLSTITEILGQRDVVTTELYTHTDVVGLRKCALNPEVFAHGQD